MKRLQSSQRLTKTRLSKRATIRDTGTSLNTLSGNWFILDPVFQINPTTHLKAPSVSTAFSVQLHLAELHLLLTLIIQILITQASLKLLLKLLPKYTRTRHILFVSLTATKAATSNNLTILDICLSKSPAPGSPNTSHSKHVHHPFFLDRLPEAFHTQFSPVLNQNFLCNFSP